MRFGWRCGYQSSSSYACEVAWRLGNADIFTSRSLLGRCWYSNRDLVSYRIRGADADSAHALQECLQSHTLRLLAYVL